MDGVVDAVGCAAYVEWTLVFHNASTVQREARALIALPPDAVVSRLTPWIDGEEREAAYAERGRVKEAYKAVVRQRRDPVLVTTAGPDRILLQCFPVPPNGGEMKTRIGISMPFHMDSLDSGLLRLPFFLEENFTATTDLGHSIWFEGGAPLTAEGTTRDLVVEQPKPDTHALRGTLPAANRAGSHIVRLWARDESLRLAASGSESDRATAVKLAVAHRLVTPITGAVVLETQSQYDAAGLTPADSTSVPHVVPEPPVAILFALGGLILLALGRRSAVRRASP